MIATAIGLMVFVIAVEFAVLPTVQRNLDKISRDWLRVLRATMAMTVTLLCLCALWAALDWWGKGFPWRSSADWTDPFLMLGTALFAEITWPRTWLNAHIDGLRARELAVEDRPDWKEATHGR